ncbi:hypothetical protein LPB90_15125, partial [Chryseobacterium sp. LC2016-29]|uniref:hypothetical protein n=1 Tax=Chryseobacterium sp. LC2016-29 TaxID=2897331 RepID=UPI001E37B54C
PISGYKEVIDGTNPVAKAKYVCTTRTIVVGCPAGMQDCEPISSTQMVCEFRDDTGGGIPPMGLNPCGDPFGGDCGGGGSGDDGYEYPEPPENTPCEKIKNAKY